MQNETDFNDQNKADWLNDIDDETQRQQYKFFMRPEPIAGLEKVTYEDDEILGPNTPVRYGMLGYVRNAKEENKTRRKIYLKPYPHERTKPTKQLQGWYQDKINESSQSRPRPCMTSATLTSPYAGFCPVGCSFCYVNSGHFRANHLVKVPMDYGKHVAKQLSKMYRTSAGYFSSFTEVFFELEDYYHNTQEGAQAFVDVGLPIFFLSRKLYPDWAIEQLQQNQYSYAQKSINTCDPVTWRRLSPKAAGLMEHMEDIRRLKAAGIYVSIQVNPIIPGVVTHGDVLKTLRMLAEAGTDHVIVKFVEAAYSWVPSFIKKIKKVHGEEKGGRFEELFTQNIGSQKTIEESYRLRGHDLYRREADKLGMTYATCYEYRFDRNPDGTPVNKTGISIGREYMSSDQCHGQRVPMFYRDSLDGLFEEVPQCPPSGCLHCADDNDGKPRCGDELAGQAKGLRMPDFKTPMVFNIEET